MLARICLALALAGAPSLVQAQNAQGQLVTPVDQRGLPFGTATNPFNVTGISGGGSGGGNAATTSNSTDGQASSATNQQNVVYNYVYNGTTWDRVRGTNGAVSTLLTGTLPAFASTPTFNLGTLNGAALDTSVQQVKTALGSPFQAGGTIGNTAFGISGTLPAFAAIPAFKIDQTTPGTTNKVSIGTDGTVTVGNPYTTTTTNALEPPTAASGKIIKTSTAVAANTSTTIAAANANRIAFGLQCASGAVAIDETGGALTAATVGNGTLVMPTGSAPYFTPPIATRTAITAYTATAQTCVVTEYLW